MTYQSKATEYKPYPDSGSLRSSTTKKGPKSPDYWGNIAINLKDMTNIKTEDGLTIVKLSGWKKVGKDGKTYLSIGVDRYVPEQKSGGYSNQSRQPTRQEDDFGDDDVPF
jgi:hypothetical protein